jgi:hypothetical protein
MKMYIVHTDTKKLFYDEQSLIKYLGTEKSKRIYYGGKYISKLDWVKIETVEVEILEESVASSYLESYIESTNRQTKVNSILGDDLSQKLEKFKSMFEEFAKDDVLRKRFLNQLETTPVEKKTLSKLISVWTGYLFSVNDSVEWFRAILDIHNFRKIDDSYVREIFYSNGTSRYQNVKVSESTKENFYKAKKLD